MCGGIEQRSQEPWSRELEVTQNLPLGESATVDDGRQGQEKGAVSEVWPADDILNAIEKDGPRCLKQHLICIRVELPQPEARAGCEAAKRIGQRMGQVGQIVEGEHMRIVGSEDEVAFLAREWPHRRHGRVNQSLEQLRMNRIGRALLA